MLFEQLVVGIGNVLVQIPPVYYLLLFVVFGLAVAGVSAMFHYHIKKYTFQNYKTGMFRLVYLGGLGILGAIAVILLGVIFSQS